MNAADCVLGVDGGGTKTTAWLGEAALGRPDRPAEPAACGSAGPGNVETPNLAAALEAIDQAIEGAFAALGRPRAPAAAACLALAGAGDANIRDAVRRFARERNIAERLVVVHDAVPVLACADQAGPAIALLSGTGSFAFGRDRAGRTVRAGGLGAFLGDEGSAYAIGRAGLRAVARAAEGRGQTTALRELFFESLAIADLRALIRWCQRGERVAHIAALAVLVDRAAQRGDEVAGKLLDHAADDLAALAVHVATMLEFHPLEYELCIAGSTLLGSARLRSATEQALQRAGYEPRTATTVAEPVQGCLRIARRALHREIFRPDADATDLLQ